jgi:hypothetical protein
MLKAIATLNRKISRDYNSTGYGITLEGEIPAGVGDDRIRTNACVTKPAVDVLVAPKLFRTVRKLEHQWYRSSTVVQ